MLSAGVVILRATFLLLSISTARGLGQTAHSLLAAFRLNGVNLRETSKMPYFQRLLSAHKRVHQFMCQLFANDASSENQHIHVIVLYALVRRVRVVTQPGTYPRKLVRSHGCTDTTSAKQHSPFCAFAANRGRNRFGKVRIVDRRCVVRAQIFHVVAKTGEVLQDLAFQPESRVVGSDGDLHVYFPCASCAFAASTTWLVV